MWVGWCNAFWRLLQRRKAWLTWEYDVEVERMWLAVNIDLN